MSLRVVQTSQQTTLILDPGRGPAGPQGPVGPTGPQGPPGSGSGSFSGVDLLFSFASPSNVWPLNHNLNTKALVVETFDHNGQSIDGEINYVDDNTIEVIWYYPVSGSARVFN